MDDVWSLMAAARQIDRNGQRLEKQERSVFTPNEHVTLTKIEAVILDNVTPDAKTEQLLRFAGVTINVGKK